MPESHEPSLAAGNTSPPAAGKIFISYRRSYGDRAVRLREALLKRGYSKAQVFLDIVTFDHHHGRFDTALYRHIEESADVIVVLTPNCLSEFRDQDDWFVSEIAHALASDKNVIPFRDPAFRYPSEKDLPQRIRAIRYQEDVEYSLKRFDACVAELQLKLKARPAGARFHARRGILVIAVLAVVVILSVIAVVNDSTPLQPDRFRTPAARLLEAHQTNVYRLLQTAYTGSPPSSEKSGPLALQCELYSAQKDRAGFTLLANGNILNASRESLVFLVNPLTDGYLYVFAIDCLGTLTLWFGKDHRPEYSRDTNPVSAHRVIDIPHETETQETVLDLDELTGPFHIYAVLCHTPWTELEDLLEAAQHERVAPTTNLATLPNNMLNRGGRGSVTTQSSFVNRTHLKQVQALSLQSQPVQSTNGCVIIERWFWQE